MNKPAWRSSPFILISVLLHAGAIALWIFLPASWPWALAALIASHASVVIAGLLPRCSLLGPNLVRLPADAITRKEVAITIDDGPDPEVTPQVLAILAAHGAKASFFCIGERAAAHPELIQAIITGGHRIENHGQRHRNHSAFFGPAGWLREVGEAQATLEAISGQSPGYFRALAGLRNPFLEPVLQQLGLRLVSWTRRGYDTRTSDADCVLARLTQDLASGDILLLHDGNSARTRNGESIILAVLPLLLATVTERGLKPVHLPTPP
ncbi:hypothetical protein GCM10027046_29040 [Uliginosibacterium flavum]|uniref:Polysaccharide deacetylase family protein n=1 Tax=Uliginosibacterium flavum TaxID=1396831 RepID=A0ABV2TGM8_9RHOO